MSYIVKISITGFSVTNVAFFFFSTIQQCYTVVYDKEKLTFEKLKPADVFHFCFKGAIYQKFGLKYLTISLPKTFNNMTSMYCVAGISTEVSMRKTDTPCSKSGLLAVSTANTTAK